MDMFKKVVLALIILAVFSVGGVLWYLSLNGRAIFIARVSSLTNRKVSVGEVRALFPMGLELKALNIEGLLTVKEARLNVDPLALLGREINFASADLEEPVLFFERAGDAALGPAPTASLKSSAPGQAPSEAVVRSRPMILQKLSLHNGAVHVKDVKSEKEWVIDKIQGDVDNIPLTNIPARTEVFLTASLSGLDAPFLGHFLKAKGWINWAARDMDVSLQAVDDDGRVGLDALLHSKANDLAVDGKARFSGSQQKQSNGKKNRNLENAVLGALDALMTDIDVGFAFHTKMDHFELAQISIAGNVVTGLQPGSTSGNIVEGLKSVGEELLRQGGPSTPEPKKQ